MPSAKRDKRPSAAHPEAEDVTVARIRDLVARSSLGTQGAVELRDRTSPELSALVRQLGDMRNRLVHSHSGQDLSVNEISDLMWIAEEGERLGLHDTARWALGEVAAAALQRLARSFDADGHPDVAKTWRARANTLHL